MEHQHDKDAVRKRLLKFLDDVIDNPDMTVKEKLRAVELMGKEFGLFIEQKNVKIDINTLVRHFTTPQLAVFTGGSDGQKSLPSGLNPEEDYIDCDYSGSPTDARR